MSEPPAETPRSPALIHRATLAALLLVLFAAYSPGLGGPFLLDDLNNVIPTHLPSLSLDDLAQVATANTAGPTLRPLASLSFGLNDYFGGNPVPQPFSYKLTNLLLHLLTTVLVYLVSVRVIATVTSASGAARSSALFVTAIWALHPLQVSTVLYVVQRMAVLSTLFQLAAFWLYLCWRQGPSDRSTAGHLLYAAGVVMLAGIGLLAKENAALFPLILLVAECTLFADHPANHQPPVRWFRRVMIYLPLVLAAGILLWWMDSLLARYGYRDFTLTQRLMGEAQALVFYLSQFVWPMPDRMGLYHDDFALPQSLDLATTGAAIVLGAGVYLAIRHRRTQPLIAFGFLWFLACHLLESTILPLELVFEHRNYMALLGPALVVGHTLRRLAGRDDLPHWARAAPVVVLLLLPTLTAWRAFHWGDFPRFVELQLRNHPQSLRARVDAFSLAVAPDRTRVAAEHLEAIGEIDPDSALPVALSALAECRLADPEWTGPHAGKVALTLSRTDDLLAPATHLRWIATEVGFGRCRSYSNADLLTMIGGALSNPGLERARKAPLVWLQLQALVHQQRGDIEAADASYAEAIERYPGNPDPVLARAYLRLNQGDVDGADEDLQQLRALNRSPGLSARIRELDGFIQTERARQETYQ